jgi:hypothetical protein
MQHTWKDKGGAHFGLEQVLRLLQDLFEEGREEGIPMVLPGHIHCPADALMDVDGSCIASQLTNSAQKRSNKLTNSNVYKYTCMVDLGGIQTGVSEEGRHQNSSNIPR